MISIIALLGAILQPTIAAAKKSALRASCQSNLRQVGLAFGLYCLDWNDHYPAAIDAYSRLNNELLEDLPQPSSSIPDMVTTLSVYTGGRGPVWRCPADNRTFKFPPEGPWAKSYPSAYAFADTSYVFYPVLYFAKTQTQFNTTQLRLSADAGSWHCNYDNPNVFSKTQNVVFGDDHVRFVSLFENQ